MPQQITGIVQSEDGQNVKYSVRIGVFTDSTYTTLQTIFSDNQFTQAPNPFNTTENGYYSFYAATEGSLVPLYFAVLNSDGSINYPLQDLTSVSGAFGQSSGGVVTGTIAANQLVGGVGTNTIGPITNSVTTWQFGQDGALTLTCLGDAGCAVVMGEDVDTPGNLVAIAPNLLEITDGTTDFDLEVNSGVLQFGSTNATVDLNGVLSITQLRDVTGGNFVGECTMSTGTTCTFSLNAAISGALCFVTAQGTDVTGGAAACSVSGTTVTITATVANSNTWAALIVGTVQTP